MNTIIASGIFSFVLFQTMSLLSASATGQTNFRFFENLQVNAQWAVIQKMSLDSKMQCSMRCALMKNCRSLTFEKRNGQCILYSALKENMTQNHDANVEYGEKIPLPKDCAEFKETYPKAPSGLVDIEICSNEADRTTCASCARVTVYCDMDTLGGGWTVFQRRVDGSVNFNRNWLGYKKGFGHPSGEHWLGNDNLFHLTSGKQAQELLIEVKQWEQDCLLSVRHADFHIGSEEDKYRLHIGKHLGGIIGNHLRVHKGMQFSTVDQDNDMWEDACVTIRKGGWWYNACYRLSLNGEYTTERCPGSHGYIIVHDTPVAGYNIAYDKSVTATYNFYSFQRAEMKFRRANFRFADESKKSRSRWCKATQKSCKCKYGTVGCI